MNIAEKFFKIYILLADNRFVSVLKKLSMAAILSVKIDGMPGKQPSHQGGHPGTAASK